MVELCSLVIEDDSELLDLLAQVIVPSVVPSDRVVACESIADLKTAVFPAESLVVLVTDGCLLDGTCEQVIEYVLATLGPRRLRGHALLTSGNPASSWQRAFSLARDGGVELFYTQKPTSVRDFEAWWRAVSADFV